MNLNKRRLSGLSLALAAWLLLCTAVNLLAVPANADDQLSSSEIQEQIDEMQRQYAENQEQIENLESQLQDNLTEMEAMVAQKNIIDQEIFLLHQQIANTNQMISAYNVLIADKQDELTKAEEKLAQLNAQNKDRIRAMEEDGPLSYWAVLFKANSFSDLLDRLNMVQEIAAADQRLLNEMRQTAETVAAAQEALVTEKANLELIREELARTEAVMQEKRLAADELLARLIATGEEYEAYLEQSEVAQAELAQQIASKEDQRDAALESEYWEAYWATYTEPPTEPPTEYVPPETEPAPPVSDTGWGSPMTRRTYVTSAYGWRWHPIYEEWRFHHGVDLEGDTGDDIVASRAGVVIKATWQSSMGYYVTIDHGDGYTSIYMHMTHYIVEVGQTVAAGEKIGECGSTGDSTGPHLHFGIYYEGSSVNPMEFISVS